MRSQNGHRICTQVIALWVRGWRFGFKVTTSPTQGLIGVQVSQQSLEGALLVGLVSDVRQVDATEVGGMVQDYITHMEGEDVVLKVLLQV